MIIVVMGVSGSGKTTVGKALARHLGSAFRDADDYHPEKNLAAMKASKPLTDEMRRPWLEAMEQDIRLFDQKGDDLVLACSALKRSYRNVLFKNTDEGVLVYLQGSKQDILPRMTLRQGHFFPPDLLDSQLNALEEPASDEPVIVLPALMDVDEAVTLIARSVPEKQTRRQQAGES